MKLKFRADAKDLTIFGVFCVVLLYLCAIAVLNLSEFSSTGTFFGLNPFPAFTSEYIAPTLVIFGVALAAIIASVSSYFFDREKGIGVTTEAKKSDGYSRWCTEKEMKKASDIKEINPLSETSDVAGIPIINNGKKIWVDAGEFHNLIIGSTGAGKTETIIQPMVKVLAKKGESMIVTDPKGEIYEKNALELKEKGYNIVILNFRNPQNGNCWNPMALPAQLYAEGDKDKGIELLEDLAINILQDQNNKSSDPFWEKTSSNYFAGLALALFEDAKPEEINLNSINYMSTAGEDKIGNNTYIKEYFSDKPQDGVAYTKAKSTLQAPNETKGSILSVFSEKIQLFASRDNLSEMLSHSDFDMHDIGRKKTAVFIVIQDEKKTYHALATIFLKQCYETLISVAQETGGKLPFKTNFILDEFANMPPLKDVTTMVTAARSRAIRFTFVIQNFAQLYEVYGKENGETIKGNCGNIIYLISSELSALEEISKLCGEVKSKDKDKTDSRPLITVSDLQRLPQYTMIVLRIRMMPFKTKVTPNWQMVNGNMWGKNYGLASYPVRTKVPVQKFDIKKFVDRKKEEKINNMLNNISGGNKKVDEGFNPFAQNKPPVPGIKPGGFDADEMVRRIEAKIAELEEEERQEKLAREKKNQANNTSNIPASPMIPKAPDISNTPNIPVTNDIKKEEAVVTENQFVVPVMPAGPVESNIPAANNIEKEESVVTENQFVVPVMPTEPVESNIPVANNIEKEEPAVTENQFVVPVMPTEPVESNLPSNETPVNSSFDFQFEFDKNEDDTDDGGEFFGINNNSNNNEEFQNPSIEENILVPTENKTPNKPKQFFDFIVPVEPEEVKEEPKEEPVSMVTEPESNPLLDGIKPITDELNSNLIPIDPLIEDIKKEEPVLEEVEIPTLNTSQIIKNEESVKVEHKEQMPEVPKQIEKNIENIESKVINNNYVTDDQFFDDFFNDED